MEMSEKEMRAMMKAGRMKPMMSKKAMPKKMKKGPMRNRKIHGKGMGDE